MRVASSALHSTSSVRLRARVTEAPTASSTAFGPIWSLCFMWTGLVEMKVWMRGRLRALERLAGTVDILEAGTRRARTRPRSSRAWRLRCTASKSPGEEIGNPASMMSTPIASSISATSSFSRSVIAAPGDCSPSRNVVSKIRTCSKAVRIRRHGLAILPFAWQAGSISPFMSSPKRPAVAHARPARRLGASKEEKLRQRQTEGRTGLQRPARAQAGGEAARRPARCSRSSSSPDRRSARRVYGSLTLNESSLNARKRTPRPRCGI